MDVRKASHLRLDAADGGQSPMILLFGNLQKRITDYMRDSNPGAGQNADNCECSSMSEIFMKPAKKVGMVFAVIHLIAFFLFVIYLNLSTDGQSRLLWTLWLTPDFPVSIFMIVGFDVISPDSQVGGFIRTWLPYLVHGVLGTIWWFFVPIMIGGIFTKILGKTG